MPVLRKQWTLADVVNVALVALPAIILLIMGYRRRWVAEDAFISLRAVDNLLAGYGPVFNVGERVEVYTHPLWVAILTFWGGIGLRLEYGAVFLGLLLSGTGLIAAQVGALRLHRYINRDDPRQGGEFFVPVGAVMFAAIPVVWDFVTSGLETGLSFAWLGISFWLLVRRVVDNSPSHPAVFSGIVFGLGPLVRPDLGIFAVGFLAALVVSELTGQNRRIALVHAAWMLAGFGLVPGVYQVFRMGYFGAVVPNTALAKEAGMADWPQGWLYFQDFNGTYGLWIPLALLAAWWAAMMTKTIRQRSRALLVLAAPVVGALLHALYIIRLGGDFMHGRFLLPTLFGLVLPLAAVPVRLPGTIRLRSLAPALAIVPVLVWALVCSVSLRWAADDLPADFPISDERAFYVEATGLANPITIEDYRNLSTGWTAHGFDLRTMAKAHPRILIMQEGIFPLAEHVQTNAGLVVVVGNVGVRGFAAGSEVYMVDFQGLGDPLAGRMRINERRRAGHEKQMPDVWFQARFGEISAIPDSPQLEAAIDVLHCEDVTRLLRAVEAPLTPRLFASNVWNSWGLTQLRIDEDPETARERLCGSPDL